MTSPLPDRRVEPLPPPPGSFDAVVLRARERRYRRLTAVTTISGVFLAGVLGGVGLAGGVTGVSERLAGVVNYARVTTTSSAGPAPSASSTRASRVPHKPTRPAPITPITRPAPAVPPAVSAPAHAARVRGRVVDPSGAPVAGMYVWSGSATRDGFVADPAPVAVTDERGRFAVACGGGPLLLTSWVLDAGLQNPAGGRWAATVVTGTRCSRSGSAQLTRVSSGGVVTGTVHTDVPCPGVRFTLSVRVAGVSTPVRVAGLAAGDRFRVSGVPDGQALLGPSDNRVAVRVVGATSVQQDVTLTCPAAPTPSETPVETGTPSPTPSPTLPTSSPSPSSSTPTTSPTPTGTATR